MTGARIGNVIGGNLVQSLGSKCVKVSWKDLLYLFIVHKLQQPLTAAHIVSDSAVRQPVNHGPVIDDIATEQELVFPVMETDAAPGVARHMQYC